MIVATSLLSGCGAPAAPELSPQASTPTAPEHPTGAARAVVDDALYHDRFARRELYTWTTSDQIAELRRGSRLLVRDESPLSGASYLDQVLHALARRGDPVATLLYTTPFANMRFAWHAPWATRFGWSPGEAYGDRLIRVTLKPDAVIVSLSTATGTFAARNLANEPVALPAVLAHPDRIAAIYFVSVAGPAAPGLVQPKATFREFALCNESMIESWEVGTDRISALVAANAAALDHVVRYLATKPALTWNKASLAWPGPAPNPTAELAFAAALAFESPMYRLDADALAAHARALRATPTEAALRGRGTTTYVPGPARKPPRIVATTDPTFGLPLFPTAARP